MGVKALRKLQLGKESTAAYGTPVAASTVWRGLGTIKDETQVVFPEEDVGILGRTARSYVPHEAASLSMPDVEATFEQLPHILAAGMEKVAASSDGAVSYVYAYDFPTTTAPTIQTFTIEGGDDTEAEEMNYSFVKSFKLSGNAGEAWMMGAEWAGQYVSTSAFSTAATIPTVEEILFSKTQLYIDPSSDTAGTSQVSGSLFSAELNVETGLQPIEVGDGNIYFSSHKCIGPTATLSLTFEHDANAVTEKDEWKTETEKVIRLKCAGSTFASTGTTYDTKMLIIDLCGKWETFDAIDDQNENDIIKGTFKVGYSSAAGKTGTITVVNGSSDLA